MSTYTYVILKAAAPVARLTINRPDALNALNIDVLTDLNAALDELSGVAGVRALIVAGAKHVVSEQEQRAAEAKGKVAKPKPAAFVAGADIKSMIDMPLEQSRVFVTLGQNVMQRLEDLPYPVIAAVDGFALGGGTELAMACDMIYASERSVFGQPEVSLGIIPGFGGTQRLQRLVGRNLAKELIFTGEHISAEEARRIGLVNKVVPAEELDAAVQKLAETIAAKGPLAIQCAKRAINEGQHEPLPRANEIEKDYFLKSFATEDRVEGTTAFAERRPPRFAGK